MPVWLFALFLFGATALGFFAGALLERRSWEEKERLRVKWPPVAPEHTHSIPRPAPPCWCVHKPGSLVDTKDLIHCGDCGGRLPF